MKKLISILLSITMVITIFAGVDITANAATRTGTTGGLSWSLDTSTGVFTLSATSGGSGYGDDYTKNSIARQTWYTLYRSSIKSVVIEEGVIGIGAYMFYNCTNLTSISFASTVDTIGDCCFRSCTSLENAVLPTNCSWYYKELFLDCTSLKYVSLPNENKTDSYAGKIPDGTFSGCTSLEEVFVGSGHTALDTKAFYNCKSLKGVVWTSGTISSTGTNALSNVPSSCVFVSSGNSLSSWASSNSVSSSDVTGTCSTNTYSSTKLTYNYNTSTRQISFSGSGDMSSTPWSVYHYFIDSLVFTAVDGKMTICDSAFYGCVNSTYWLDIPSTCTSIGSNAFNNTNFNYVKILSPSISIQTNSFGCTGYARFFGLHDSGAYDFVKSGKSAGYSWYYYCLNDDHGYVAQTVSPTCTEQGYDLNYCQYCEVDSTKSNYTSALGHTYSQGTDNGDGTFSYACTRCGSTNLTISSVALLAYYENSISHDNDNPAFMQSNYDAQFDVHYDGYINAKDFLLLDKSVNKISVTNKETTINTSTTYQTIDGFGASGAWWAQDVGTWTDEQIDVVTELLYGETGAGLDIYRYNLGAGSEDDTHISDWRRRAEDFLLPTSDINDASTYDWTADSASQKVLASVQRANSDMKLTLFSNSAPVSLTTNGKAYCSYGATSNLAESNYQAYANYIVNCAEHFIEEGYNVTEVSPVNEPEWGWAADESGNCSQEGAHWEYSALTTFYNNYMVPALKSSSLNGTVGLSVWESGQLNHSSYWNNLLNNLFSSNSSYSSKNANIRSYVDSLDTHSYWASTSDRTTVANQISGSNYSAIQKVRCTEYCQMTNDGSSGTYNFYSSADNGDDGNGMSIYYALALADIMYQDLTILNAVEWDWWTACSGGIYPDGLVYVDYDDPDNVQTAKRLWAMGNYAKFIDEGATRVSVSTGSSFGKNITTSTTYGDDKSNYIEESAYLNPDGSVVVVYINNSDTTEYTTFGTAYTSLETYVTDETRDLEKFQTGTAQNRVVEIPAKSITTVVLK